jgi:citrate lyase subunit beta/citryl-CoA lyase
MVTVRSYLYVPGDQPRMLAKATARGADALIIDLEDAVAPAMKDTARQAVAEWLAAVAGPAAGGPAGQAGGQAGPEIWIRVNEAGPDGSPPEADLRVAAHPAVTGIVQAKCADAGYLGRLAAALDEAESRAGISRGALKVTALVESAAGVQSLAALAAAPRVCRFQLGEADLVAELGMEPGPDGTELLAIRVSVVVASAAAGLDPPVGAASTDLADSDGLRRGTEALRRLGFAGRTALHPAQVAVINEVFTPTSAQEERARALLARYRQAIEAGQGVFTDDRGSMVDKAVVRAASNVVTRARLSRGRAAATGGDRDDG